MNFLAHASCPIRIEYLGRGTAVALSISAVVLLAIIVVILVRKSGLKGGHAVVCVLLGFYLASSSVAPTITDLTTTVAGMIGGIKF